MSRQCPTYWYKVISWLPSPCTHRAGRLIKRQRCCCRKLKHFPPAVSFPPKVTDEVNKACRNSCTRRKWDTNFQHLCLQVTVTPSHSPAPWPQWESPPRRRSWSWPRWWTDSPPTRTCRPAPAVASSGTPAPAGENYPGRKKIKEELCAKHSVTDWAVCNMDYLIDLCDSHSPHFSSRCAGCWYLFPAQSCCKKTKDGSI